MPPHLHNSDSDNDTDLKEGPPEDPGVVTLHCVPVSGLPGLEEMLMGGHFVQLLSYGVQLFLRPQQRERERERGGRKGWQIQVGKR